MLPALLAPILTSLASNGLGILAGAIQAKGKEVIENKLGVKIPENASALTPELMAKLKEKEMEHEEFLIETQLEEVKLRLAVEAAASTEVTERWKADMASDSYLSKNIRPLTLIFILAVYTIFALMSAFDKGVNEAYVALLGQWGMLIMSAYFVGRTVEKATSIVKGRSEE